MYPYGNRRQRVNFLYAWINITLTAVWSSVALVTATERRARCVNTPSRRHTTLIPQSSTYTCHHTKTHSLPQDRQVVYTTPLLTLLVCRVDKNARNVTVDLTRDKWGLVCQWNSVDNALVHVATGESAWSCTKLQNGWVGGTTGSASDQQSTNDRKVAGSKPTKVVCITVLSGNRMGWTARYGLPPLLLPSCRKLEFRVSALMYSDLGWVNGKTVDKDDAMWTLSSAL